MATRATYTLRQKETRAGAPRKGGVYHVYIHYDGYPEGAAEYFAAAMKLRALRYSAENLDAGLRGSLPEQFIRANALAEFTNHPDDHGDTEFHYDIAEVYNAEKRETTVTVKAYKLANFSEKVLPRTEFFNGPIEEFIKRYQVIRVKAQEEVQS